MPFDADIQAADAITLDRLRTQMLREEARSRTDFQNRMSGPNANDWMRLYEINLAARKTSMTIATTDAAIDDIVRDAVRMTDSAFSDMVQGLKNLQLA